MAKHPHKLLLLNGKTWRCVRDGCAFFVHSGLAHILIGKQAICWDCEEQFALAQWSLKDDKPICNDCRSLRAGVQSEALDDYIERKLTAAKTVIKSEVVEDHSPDCDSWDGGECSCQ
jgi:hypothetical protein